MPLAAEVVFTFFVTAVPATLLTVRSVLVLVLGGVSLSVTFVSFFLGLGQAFQLALQLAGNGGVWVSG